MRNPRQRAAFLVADDVPLVAALVAELLSEAGVDVVGPATDGTEALRLFREGRLDGAVLDFEMPGASGLEVLRAIRAEQGPEPFVVIMLTSHAEPSVRDACVAAGADHFLDKATDFDRLAEIVSAYLGASAGGDGPRQQSTDIGSDI